MTEPLGQPGPLAPQSPPRLRIDRLGRNLLFTTAFIWHEPAPGVMESGTAFFYDGARNVENGNRLPVLVTNRHVVAGATNGSVRFIRAAGEEPMFGEAVTASFTAADWVMHPDPAVDVAVTFIGPALSGLHQQGLPVFYRLLGHDLVPTRDVVDDLDVVEPVTFVGYPSGLFDRVNLTPIVRRGTTATPVQLDYSGMPAFLIDASIFPGSSGSPVFIVNENGYRQGNTIMMGSTRVLFLGIVAAVHHQQAEARIVQTAGARIEYDRLLNLGIVYRWNAIDEAVDELCRQRGVDRP